MRPAADTLRRLRGSIGGCTLLLALAAAVAWQADRRAGDFERQAAEHRAARGESARRLDALRGEATRLESFAARHARLLQEGRFAPFDKTVEVDRFERAATELGARGRPAVERYVLRPRVPLPADVETGLARHAVTMQPLAFEMTARHEEEFLRVWSGLSDAMRGIAALERCDLRPGSAPSTMGGGPASTAGAVAGGQPHGWPTLRIGCTLVWYAIEPRRDETPAGAAIAAPGAAPPGGRS